MEATARQVLVRTAIQLEPEALTRIARLAAERRVSRSTVMRDALREGLPLIERRQQIVRALESGDHHPEAAAS